MVELLINRTAKSFNPRETYSTFDIETKTFDNMDEAKQWLRDEYGNCKRSPMYRDYDDAAHKIGYVFGFRNSDISHDSKPWLQQDWVSFYEVTRKPIEL